MVLRKGDHCFVLIDGYLRVKALKRCLRDTVIAEIWRAKKKRLWWRFWPEPMAVNGICWKRRPLKELMTNTICPRAELPPWWDGTELGLRPIGSLQRPLGRPFGVDSKGGDLDLGCHPGDCPYCARNTGARKGAFRESFQTTPVHPGADPLVPPLPEGQSEAEGEPGL